MNATAVNETLLKKLSRETQLVGEPALIKGSDEEPECQAVIGNVIILPFAPPYRALFMRYYELYKQNAVKALKELLNHVPYTPAYELDIAYVLTVKTGEAPGAGMKKIKRRGEFMLAEDLAAYRQEILTRKARLASGF